jgi:hypothetical protein
MSTTVNLQDGGQTVVLFLTGLNEGSGDTETLAKKIDAALLNPKARKLRIMKIEYNISGGIVSLYRDTTNPIKIIDLAGDGTFDFTSTGGMPEEVTDGSDSDTGSILLSTQGFDIGSSYAIRLELKKKLVV